MNKFLLQATFVVTVGGISCWADALHGYCAGLQCLDSSTNSPTINNPPRDFGFTINGGGTGNLLLDILIPNNEDPSPSSFSFDLTGTLPGTATLFSTTPWTSGFLATYLGINAQPKNPIGAYLGLDPGATGFFVYQADFPKATLQSVPDPNSSPLENFAPGDHALPMGSYITGFFNEGTSNRLGWVGTANSGAIFVDAPATPSASAPSATTPEPSSIVLLGSVALGLATLLKRKRHSRA